MNKNIKITFGLVLATLVFMGCQFLPSTVNRSISSEKPISADMAEFNEVKKIFDNRCVACHSCYNAACQLKLSSFEGIDRGLHPTLRLYDNKRIKSEKMMARLFTDAHSTEEWRNNFGFQSILDRDNTKESLLVQALKTKMNDSTDPSNLTPAEDSHKLVCANKGAAAMPMPYGLPAISQVESDKIINWVEKGSFPSEKDLAQLAEPSGRDIASIKQWEGYLNRNPLKSQLISRYLYEHLFLAHIYFDEKNPEFYNMIRSSKPCSDQLEISSRRPYDNPGEDLFYCFRKITSTIVHKNHITYPLTSDKWDRIQTLFEKSEWNVSELPSYDIKTASNPFLTFKDIPANTRYQFLLDNTEYFVRTFIRGPVCRGNTAVNVINEQFHVMFVDPKTYEKDLDQFLQVNAPLLGLPAQYGSDLDVFSPVGTVIGWFGKPLLEEAKAIAKVMLGTKFYTMGGFKKYLSGKKIPKKGLSADRIQYRKNRYELFKKVRPNGYTLSDIWDGGSEKNNNALLTVIRHYDSASVNKGAIGSTPKTMWIIDYPLLEGIYYNLVVGFDVYGDAGHQASTRYYKSSQRFDGEEHFLYIVPKELRAPMRASWYRDGDKGARAIETAVQKWYPIESMNHSQVPVPVTAVTRGSDGGVSWEQLTRVRKEIFSRIYKDRFKHLFAKNAGAPVTAKEFSSITGKLSENEAYVKFFPELSYIRHNNEVYSLARNMQHFNVTWAKDEDLRRDSKKDTLIGVKGFIGSYPLQFFDASSVSIQSFVQNIKNIKSKTDYGNFMNKFGISRTDSRFWETFDFMVKKVHESPLEGGVFDLNRYGSKVE